MAPLIKVYVQGDWVSSGVCNESGLVVDDTCKEAYTRFLAELEEAGFENVATWHKAAQGVVKAGMTEKDKSTDVLRNFAEIKSADYVVTRLTRTDPKSRHWGSISLITYALALDKRCFVYASDDNIVWKHHVMHHHNVVRLKTIEELKARAPDPWYQTPSPSPVPSRTPKDEKWELAHIFDRSQVNPE
jgi:nucleoside 2-deoxyribosyltransferase